MSILGYAVTVGTVAFILLNFKFGHDLLIWDRVGDQVRAGLSPYGRDASVHEWFFYAPPWALWFAAGSWLPFPVFAAAHMTLEVLALRVCAGSWQRVGYVGLVPLIGYELAIGQVNLILAAGVALALRGDGRLAALGALAKWSPALAISDVRRAGLTAAIAVALTLPVAWLWGEWAEMMLAAARVDQAAPMPYVARLALALGVIVVVRRPWARGLAVFLALPNFSAVAYVLLVGLLPSIPSQPPTATAAAPLTAQQPSSS